MCMCVYVCNVLGHKKLISVPHAHCERRLTIGKPIGRGQQQIPRFVRKLACNRAKNRIGKRKQSCTHAKIPDHQPDKCGTKGKARKRTTVGPDVRYSDVDAASVAFNRSDGSHISAALVVITSFCSRCGCSCCCCCYCVPCRWQGEQKKKKAARGFLAARAICGLSTRLANNENAFQLLLLPRCASLTGAANGPSRLAICIQHQLNRFLAEPIVDAATWFKVVYSVKTVIYAWLL